MVGCFGTKKAKDKRAEIDKQLVKDKEQFRATHRLLLLGISISVEILFVMFI